MFDSYVQSLGDAWRVFNSCHDFLQNEPLRARFLAHLRKINAIVSQSCLQGGVLFPILWNLLVNDLIEKLTKLFSTLKEVPTRSQFFLYVNFLLCEKRTSMGTRDKPLEESSIYSNEYKIGSEKVSNVWWPAKTILWNIYDFILLLPTYRGSPTGLIVIWCIYK